MDLATLVHHDRILPGRKSSPSTYGQPSSPNRDRESNEKGTMALQSNPYAQRPSNYTPSHTPQPPPTPPVEEARCTLPSLPSISNLIAQADGASHSPQSSNQPPHHQQAPPRHQGITDLKRSHPSHPFLDTNLTRSPVDLPPTPPMRAESQFDERHHSPTSSHPSFSSFSSMPSQAGSAINNVDASAQRQPSSPHARNRHSQSSASYQSSPNGTWSSYYGSPTSTSHTASSGIYSQRPLPQTFPPPIAPITITPATSASSDGQNPWQHHHYISPSSQAAFPPSQDRYICPQCDKAFSRPSSLRIHSHSHSGEKPFKCPHHGCGKAFSVRSNMKRHERGCHASSPSSI